jgi:rod shape-determining protein MreD
VNRVALAAWALALAGLWIVGSAAAWIPRGWLPDPALLVAVALGLRVPGAPGLATAWVVGWTADLLSAGPLGRHALLDMGAWLLVRWGAQRVDLARSVVLVPVVVALTAAHVVGEWLLGGVPEPGRAALAVAIPHATANAAAALAVRRLFDAVLGRVDPDDPMHGALRIDPGTGVR